MAPYCVPCKRDMRCKKNGVFLRVAFDHWIAADHYFCEECDSEVLSGYARDRGGSHIGAEARVQMEAVGVIFFNREKNYGALPESVPSNLPFPSASDRVAEQPGPF